MSARFSMRSSSRAARLSAAAFARFVAVVLMTSLADADTPWNVASGDWSVASNWNNGVRTGYLCMIRS